MDPSLGLEELVVALVCPHAPADGRTFKLVVRVLQSADVDVARLAFLAKRERASGVLYWLLSIVPEPERNERLSRVARTFSAPPRGYRGVSYRYDAQRLIKRVATEAEWRRKPS